MPRRRTSDRAAPRRPAAVVSRTDEEFTELRGLLDAPLAARPEARPVVGVGAAIGASTLGRIWHRFVDSTGGRLTGARAYLRAGAVLDLQVHRGIITAEVQGSRRYHVKIAVALPGAQALLELQGRLGDVASLRGGALQDAILGVAQGLMPAPRHLVPFCQCPDTAPFCKHVCAALYGLAVRLDSEPGLLLVLRGAVVDTPAGAQRSALAPLAAEKRLDGDLGALFGIELLAPARAEPATEPAAPPPGPGPAPGEPTPDGPPADAAPADAAELLRGPAEVRREYLRELGIPTPTIDAWLREGVLRRTGRHGVYERTPEASRRIAAHLGV